MAPLLKKDFEVILNSLEEGVIISDRDRNILFFNDTAAKMLGHKPEHVIGRKCYEVFQSNRCDCNCALSEALTSGREVLASEVKLVSSQGGKTYIKGRTLPFKTGDDLIGVIQLFSNVTELVLLRDQLRRRPSNLKFVTKSPKMMETIGILPDLAKSDVTILISGETGTGKEVLAKDIYSLSLRKHAPFIRVNCGALPDSLLEAELFGNVAGAYTDAKKARKGRLEMAEGGTIFLDEIGEMSTGMQVKLLRVLQEKTYEPLGSSKTRVANVRFISATNQDLQQMVEEGKFRQDLFYRINTMVIQIPPLRERREDIPLLVNHFLQKYSVSTGKIVHSVNGRVMDVFMEAPWPGNVRQLEHVIEHAFVLVKGDEILREHLPRELRINNTVSQQQLPGQPSLSKNIQSAQKEIILSCLIKNDWNKVTAAKELGISRTTLWRRIKELNIL